MSREKKRGAVLPVEKTWLTSSEAMSYLGCGKNTLVTARNSGNLEVSRIGRNYLYSLRSLERYIEKNRIV